MNDTTECKICDILASVLTGLLPTQFPFEEVLDTKEIEFEYGETDKISLVTVAGTNNSLWVYKSGTCTEIGKYLKFCAGKISVYFWIGLYVNGDDIDVCLNFPTKANKKVVAKLREVFNEKREDSYWYMLKSDVNTKLKELLEKLLALGAATAIDELSEALKELLRKVIKELLDMLLEILKELLN